MMSILTVFVFEPCEDVSVFFGSKAKLDTTSSTLLGKDLLVDSYLCFQFNVYL